MNVVVAVAGSCVPAWHAWCIEALRKTAGLNVRVVRVGELPWRPSGSFAAFLAGDALRPVQLVVEDADLSGADLIVDLCGNPSGVHPPHGVWSFRVGAVADPALPFARELAAGERTAEVELVRCIGGCSESLRVGRFALMASYHETLRVALAEAGRWPATFAAALNARRALESVAGPNQTHASGPLLAIERVRFAGALVRRVVQHVVGAVFRVRVEWNVGFVDGGPRVLLADAPLSVRWLPRPAPLTFVADPFLAERDGIRALFVEQYDFRRARGVIDAFILDEHDAVVRRVRALERETHLSYPYPLESDGELYLVPENWAAGEVALYRCLRFPDQWERERVIFPFDGVDTTVFAYEDRSWAFCTRQSGGSALALHAFHAPSPCGPWTPHALNPIVVDVTRARPAGTPFVVDDILYRPGQDCSASYGEAVALARVNTLTPDAYSETVVRRIDGHGMGRYRDGVHTICVWDGRVVIDGKRNFRDPRQFVSGMRQVCAELALMVRKRGGPRDACGARVRDTGTPT